MTDFPANSEKQKRKRKLGSSAEKQTPHKNMKKKKQKVVEEAGTVKLPVIKLAAEKAEESQTWNNLNLILSLQNKNETIQRKVELAYNFVITWEKGDGESNEAVSVSRLLQFLNDWILSVLIPKANGKGHTFGDHGISMDIRCWAIFRFCLLEASFRSLSLNFSRYFLRSVVCASESALGLLNKTVSSGVADFGEDEFQVYNIVLECSTLVFRMRKGVLSDNLDLWLSAVDAVLQLANRVFSDAMPSRRSYDFSMNFSSLVLDSFSEYLKIHPCRKNGFQDFVDRLLEPLFHLSGLLYPQPGATKLSKAVHEVLSQGLFHNVHIDGFLNFGSTEQYVASSDAKPKEKNLNFKSYHRHLFGKLEKIICDKKVSLFGGVNMLFQLLIQRVKIHKIASSPSKDSHLTASNGNMITDSSGDDALPSVLSTDLRKSLFDVFAQIMEPLLLELSNYIELEIEIGPVLLDIYGVLKCIKSVLNVLVQEKVYSRTEDTSESACFEYLKKVFDTVMVFSTKLSHIWLLAYKTDACKHNVTLISEEFIHTVGGLLEIDYKVTGDDLLRLWSMMFSLFAFGSGMGEQDTLSLCAKALSFGCQLLNLYRELRQVTSVIVSFCEAIRCLEIHNSLPWQLYTRSISKLIGSQTFGSALVNAVKSIPEGQASGCIHQIAEDISDSVEWIKASCLAASKEDKNQFPSKATNMEYFFLHLEVFGVGLSEIYSLVLKSVSVTSGNSSLIGTSLEEIMEVMRPIMSSLVIQRPNLLDFLVSFIGVTPYHELSANEFQLQNLRGSVPFICLFFFRLYVSCRSVYRQAISLVAPKISRKFSKLMGDTVSAYSGAELLEINGWTSEDYFSWILQPSATLRSVIKLIQRDLLCDSITASPALTYVLYIMAIQRLVDLNRRLKTLEYLQQSTAYRVQSQMDVEADSVSGCKITSVENHISVLRQEALKLVDFMMGHLSLITEDYSTLTEIQTVEEWDSVICSLNTKSLATAIWKILCQNIDVWSVHVAKKQLKIFLTKLISTSLSRTSEHGPAETVNIQNISLELLRNSMLYEQKSTRRHLASRLCVIIQKSMLTLSNRSGNMNHEFGTSALLEVLASLDKHVVSVLMKKALSCEVSSQMNQRPQLLSCERFLGLLCWMPLDYLKLKSFSGLASAVLDLERLVIANIIETCSPPYEWLSLLVACRRALKHIVMAACENTETSSPFFLVTPDNSVAMLWFLKTISAMFELSLKFSKIGVFKCRQIIFTLLDHTSSILLNLCKSQVHHILVNSNSFSKEAFSLVISDGMDHSGDNDAWRNLVTMAETLKNETDKLDFSVSRIKGFDDNVSGGPDGMNLWMNNLSCHLACVHGFLWGLASALATKKTSAYETKVEKDRASEVKVMSSMFSDFLNKSLQYVLYEQSQWPGIICHTGVQLSNGFPRVPSSLLETSKLTDYPYVRSYFESDSIPMTQLLSEDDKHAANVPIEESLQRHFNRFLLRSLLKDDYPEAAFLLRQLFLTASAGIKLDLHIYRLPTSSSSTHLLTCVSRLVLSELIGLDESLPPFSFIWLDGVLKYLEELGNHISINKSNQMINDSYNKLIDLLLRVDGKCISFIGKQATLSSHDTESITKMLDSQTLFTTAHYPLKPNAWNEFKCRLRTSVIGFISNASEQHLLFVIQAIDRALVGVQEGSTIIYEVVTGSAGGGQVSPKVAAGVDFLDLVLEHASGRKRLGVIQRHIQRLVSGLFNIIWHLRSPHIFMEQSTVKQDSAALDPDPGAVTLMCTEVLTRIFAKQALFRLNYGHAGQALRLPGALFQNFLQINHDSCMSDQKEASGFTAALTTLSCVDRKFSIDLYAASCRLLSTIIKHYKEYALDMLHKVKSAQSIGVLEDSLSVLLYCLETMNGDLVTNGYFSWQVEEGVRLASLLRRVYEEIRQQKDVFGQWIFLFLSHYIQVYSGFGPNRTGIRREIDEALKPGIYALVDACSAEDLQHLHTVFGEGPCRSTLARLRQDYESNFRYVGKVCCDSCFNFLVKFTRNTHCLVQESWEVETLKCLLSLAALSRIWRNEGVTDDNRLSTTFDEVIVYPVPAALYLVKNLLQYYIFAYVDAPAYQILKNVNIISTGVLYRIILKRKLSEIQWAAFILLCVGCTTAQLNPSSDHVLQTPLQGWIMAIVMALLSGFAGVYTEAIRRDFQEI